MKRTVMFSLAALAVLTFANCSGESLDEMGGTSAQNNEIGFDGYLGRSAVGARASVLDKDALQTNAQGFGVFGLYKKDASSSAVTMFDNTQVTYNSKWGYTDTKYWPNTGSIDFYAYAPYKSGVTLSDTKISYDASYDVDLIYASATGKTKANNGSAPVKFTFKHALSKIGFEVLAKDAYNNVTITVKSVKLGGNKDVTMGAFHKSGSLNLADGTWSDFTGTLDVKTWNAFLSSSATVTNASGAKNMENEFLFVIPQDFSSTGLYVQVVYTVNYQNGIEEDITAVAQVQKNFEKGKAYTLKLNVGLSPIEFDVETVEAWNNDEDVTVNVPNS